MTTATPAFPEALLHRMPSVRGRLTANAPLKGFSWFQVGGPAEVLFQPADDDDLSRFLKDLPPDVPLTFLGAGSNTLIRDGGVPGVVIRLGPAFAALKVEGEKIAAGGAALDLNIARAAQKAGLAGLEFLSGIPGTLGGALRMNAGAYGKETADILESVTIIDRHGEKRVLRPEDLNLSYRHCGAAMDQLFTMAVLKGHRGDPQEIAARMAEIRSAREKSQPLREKTCGSTFANPPGQKAWALIEAAGGRGLSLGGAKMSEKHCNFMINTGTASAQDLETLGEEIRRRVKEMSGVDLRWELRRIGLPLEQIVVRLAAEPPT